MTVRNLDEKEILQLNNKLNEKQKTIKGLTKLRAVIYARKSTKDNKRTSLSMQISICKKFIKKYKFMQLTEVYQEDGVSGMFTDGRTEYQKMISAVVNKEIDVVVVMKLDRLARNITDMGLAIKLFQLNDCTILAGDDVPCADTPDGEFMRNILLCQNQYHARRVASDVMSSECNNAQKGVSAGGKPPYGLKVVKKHFIIDQDEAPAVKMMFEMIAKGNSYKAVIDRLTSLGYVTRAGEKFSYSSLNSILHNEKYYGTYVYNRIGGKRKKKRVLIEHFDEVRNETAKQQESSITVQLAAIRKFCAENKVQLIREYVDEEQTGTNANRKQFQQLMKDAPAREFQMVIVHRMDRWARNVDDARYYKKLLSRYGIKMISAIEAFDETPEGEFFELLSMGMAELYSKKLAREAVAGKIANAKLGRIYGGVPLLGYKVKGKYYVIDEQEAKAVKLIFDMTLKGYGYATIRDYLNENGYRHSDGRTFSSAFNDILRNRRYIGEYIYNRLAYRARGVPYNSHQTRSESEIIRIPNGMPRIIDDDTFQAVQVLLDSRKRRHGTPVTQKAYLLSGVLRCAECGTVYCGSHQIRHGVYNSYYKCNLKTHRCIKSKRHTEKSVCLCRFYEGLTANPPPFTHLAVLSH